MDRVAQAEMPEQSQRASSKPKRQWRAPEIVNLGGVLDLTEAATTNVNDSPSASMATTYRP
jgi:hypothetical protein